MIHKTEIRSLLAALYPVAALLMIAPAIDLVGTTWPLRPSQAGWRFGSLGVGFGFIIIEILGLALAMALAAVLDHRRMLRALSTIAIGAAIATVAGIARFMLDYGDLRSLVPAGQSAQFDSTTIRALLLACLAVPVLAALGGRGWTASAPPNRDAWLQPAGRPDYVIPLRIRDHT